MSKILIVGCNGSMGRRYQVILNHLGIKFTGVDVNHTYPVIRNGRAIICTPSRTHTIVAEDLIEIGYTDLLIEKPMFDCKEDYSWARANNKFAKMQMVCNYKFLDTEEGETYYNYYDAGKEAEKWNLFQLIGLARNGFKYEKTSPIWQCILNGRVLTLEEVQLSYVTMIKSWFDGAPLVSIEEAFEWFQKAEAWAA